MAQPGKLQLTPEESDALNQIAETGSASAARRARIILLTAEGLALVAIAADVGLSERQVRRWQRAFETDRLSIFSTARSDSSDEGESPAPRSDEPEAPAGAEPPPEPGVEQPRLPLTLRKKPGVEPDLPMSEAGRKVLHFHFERMLLHEPGSRLGEDIEAVHDMRVATRRMRSAFDLFAPYYRRKVFKPLLNGLRRTGRALGAVRDLDVFREKLGHYEETLPEEAREGLAPLLEAWHTRREKSRQRLIAHLNGDDFARFVEAFHDFLTTEGAGARKVDTSRPVAYQVRYVVPRLVYERYETVRAYETVLDAAPVETLHALRIDFKRLRYTLEFFVEALGPEAENVIEEVKRMQDHLGDLNDAEVAGAFLRDFIDRYEAAQAGMSISERRSIAPIAQYMASRLEEKHHLMITFPETWARFNRPDVRRDLALAVAAL